MEVDAATSAIQTPAKHLLPELEIYCYLLVLLFLIDKKKYNEVSPPLFQLCELTSETDYILLFLLPL